MRVALLAPFPLHVVPSLGLPVPARHYATWLPQLCEHFEEAEGFDLHWIVMTRDFVSAEPVRWRNQTFHPLYNPARLRMLSGYARDRRLIAERLEQLQPDLVHAWGTEDCYGLAGARSGRPWLLSMQGILREYIRRTRMHPFVHLQALYEAYILGRAHEISVESHWGGAVMRRLAPHARVHLIEYGVQEIFFAQAWEPAAERPHAVFIGTTHDGRKGLPDAVAAFASPELQGAELHVIGDKDSAFARKLRLSSTPNVKWPGRLSTPATAEALRRAWCLVLPTKADTSPNVVKEARVIGLPVVTTPEGGQSDYIADGVNGFLVPPGAPGRLAARLAEVLLDLPRARALGAARHEEQRAFFRPERTAEKFLALYRELAGRPRENAFPTVGDDVA